MSPKPRDRRDLFPGAFEMMILRTLKRQPLHGYALTQEIKRVKRASSDRRGLALPGSTAHVEGWLGYG